eukprot:GHRR01031119.1.p1 GENE.GHRR01031119.1~~GHRR01031119.1.p1  ORF type:complete len:145 (+),score=59.96 GHRR01031119.1:345-779(+)
MPPKKEEEPHAPPAEVCNRVIAASFVSASGPCSALALQQLTTNLHTLSQYDVCLQQQPDEPLSGKFYFKDGSTYEGHYKMVGLPQATAPEPVRKGGKRKEEEAAAQPAEPPKAVRHGVGEHAATMCSQTGSMLRCAAAGMHYLL